MRDVVFLLLTAAFFALCLGYLALCGRIIGPDVVEAGVDGSEARDEVSA